MEEPERVVAHLTRFFENSGDLPSHFTEAEILRGLHYLIDPGQSSSMFALMNDSLPWGPRERAVRAISLFYRDLFMPRCRVDARLRPDPACKLNEVCLMWWDVCPLPGESERLGRVVLDVLRGTLELPSLACRQSTLHGLSHNQHRLANNRDAPRALFDYARRARSGSLL